MPLLERIWKEILIDFVVNLPISNSFRHLIVVTDRLSKDMILTLLQDLKVERVAAAFIERVVAYY